MSLRDRPVSSGQPCDGGGGGGGGVVGRFRETNKIPEVVNYMKNKKMKYG